MFNDTDVYLDGATKQPIVVSSLNPLRNDGVWHGLGDKRNTRARSSRELKTGSSKKLFRAKSVGQAVVVNALRAKRKQGRAGLRAPRSSSLRGPKKDSKEPAEKQHGNARAFLSGEEVVGDLVDIPTENHVILANPDTNHITECANMWAIIGFVVTTTHAGIYLAFAASGDLIYQDFYAWVTKPVSLTVLFISFSLKPRREDFLYKFMLYLQWSIFCIFTEVSKSPTKLVN